MQPLVIRTVETLAIINDDNNNNNRNNNYNNNNSKICLFIKSSRC